MSPSVFRKWIYFTSCGVFATSCLAAPATLPSNTTKLTDKQKLGLLIMEAPVQATARKALQKMAVQGDSFAQLFVGGMYENGIGVPRDDAKAVYWIRKSAMHGCVPAQYEFAEMYRVGKVIPKDYSKAVYWYRKTANYGFDEAQLALGNMYSHGWGVKKDIHTALYWYREAAKHGNTDAYIELGMAYISGHGVQSDYVQAAKWLILADIIGQGKAEQLLEKVKRNLTSMQMKKAQHLAHDWARKHGKKQPDYMRTCSHEQ